MRALWLNSKAIVSIDAAELVGPDSQTGRLNSVDELAGDVVTLLPTRSLRPSLERTARERIVIGHDCSVAAVNLETTLLRAAPPAVAAA